MTDLSASPLAEIIAHCQAETIAYLRTRRPGCDCYCLELFRRAAQDSDQRAWAFIYTFYSTEEFLGEHYLLKWVRSWLSGRHGAAIRTYYTEEEMVQEIWLRFMRSEAAKKFNFHDMRQVMGFLRRLTNNFALDVARRKLPEIFDPLVNDGRDDVDDILDEYPGQEETMEDRMVRQEAMNDLLREIIGVTVTTEREWIVFHDYFLDELPPRKLYELHPGVFSQGEVETIRTRLTRRLRRTANLLWRYIEVVVLMDDERQKYVFEHSLVGSQLDHEILRDHPDWFPSQTDLLAVKVQVLEALRNRPMVLKLLDLTDR